MHKLQLLKRNYWQILPWALLVIVLVLDWLESYALSGLKEEILLKTSAAPSILNSNIGNCTQHRKMAPAVDLQPPRKKLKVERALVRYINLHKAILSGKAPQKYVVWYCPYGNKANCGGFTDRMRGAVTALALAMISDRAFLMDWRQV